MEGTFASIEKRISGNGSCLAYKTYSKSHGKLVRQHYERELWAFKQLQIHDKQSSAENHIIHLLDNQETSTFYYLIFPYYNANLSSYMSEKNPTMARDFIHQISKGLLYLHENGIIHCDLSPSNILVDDLSGCMFICDFGCAHSSSDASGMMEEEIGTRYYKAPEHLFGSRKYAPSTDIWSMGAIFVQLLIGYPIFAGESNIEQIGRIVGRLGKPSVQVEQEEMSNYPDANKLMFFTGRDDGSEDEFDYEFESDDEEMLALNESKVPLMDVLKKENVSAEERRMILGTLTWSIKDRLKIPEIISMIPIQ